MSFESGSGTAQAVPHCDTTTETRQCVTNRTVTDRIYLTVAVLYGGPIAVVEIVGQLTSYLVYLWHGNVTQQQPCMATS